MRLEIYSLLLLVILTGLPAQGQNSRNSIEVKEYSSHSKLKEPLQKVEPKVERNSASPKDEIKEKQSAEPDQPDGLPNLQKRSREWKVSDGFGGNLNSDTFKTYSYPPNYKLETGSKAKATTQELNNLKPVAKSSDATKKPQAANQRKQ